MPLSLYASLRQIKPDAFDWSIMDDFAEWKMTGYFLEVYHDSSNSGFYVSRAWWNKGGIQVIWFGQFLIQQGDEWRTLISAFLLLFSLLPLPLHHSLSLTVYFLLCFHWNI